MLLVCLPMVSGVLLMIRKVGMRNAMPSKLLIRVSNAETRASKLFMSSRHEKTHEVDSKMSPAMQSFQPMANPPKTANTDNRVRGQISLNRQVEQSPCLNTKACAKIGTTGEAVAQECPPQFLTTGNFILFTNSTHWTSKSPNASGP